MEGETKTYTRKNLEWMADTSERRHTGTEQRDESQDAMSSSSTPLQFDSGGLDENDSAGDRLLEPLRGPVRVTAAQPPLRRSRALTNPHLSTTARGYPDSRVVRRSASMKVTDMVGIVHTTSSGPTSPAVHIDKPRSVQPGLGFKRASLQDQVWRRNVAWCTHCDSIAVYDTDTTWAQTQALRFRRLEDRMEAMQRSQRGFPPARPPMTFRLPLMSSCPLVSGSGTVRTQVSRVLPQVQLWTQYLGSRINSRGCASTTTP